MTIQSRILIADNDEANVQLLSDICLSENLDVLVAQDGAETLEKIDDHHPDLVLLDVMMPKLDGFEVLEHLRARPSTRTLPVILLTAVSDDDSIRRGYQLGANDYITKPFKVAELVSRMSSLIQAAAYQRFTQGALQWMVGDRKSLLETLASTEAELPISLLLLELTRKGDQEQTPHRSRDLATYLRLRLRGVDSAHLLRPNLLALVLVATDGDGADTVAQRLAVAVDSCPRLEGKHTHGVGSWAVITTRTHPTDTSRLLEDALERLG